MKKPDSKREYEENKYAKNPIPKENMRRTNIKKQIPKENMRGTDIKKTRIQKQNMRRTNMKKPDFKREFESSMGKWGF